MRLLYWPNEPVMDGGTIKPSSDVPTFTQRGGRYAFTTLLQKGEISALEIFPYQERLHTLGERFQDLAIQNAVQFRPDIVFIQHVTGCDIPDGFWKALRKAIPHATIAYHDADPYSPHSKRIDRPMKDLLRNCDASIVCGLGYVHRRFREISGKPVGYSPHCYEASAFMASDVKTVPKEYDLVMVGNRGNRRRATFLYHPGGRTRARLASLMSEEYGTAFALFGNGWDGLTASRGRVGFFEQERAIQRARVSINWDHFDEIPYYFSDRLPISLAAGVPHITSYHPGYEHELKDCPGLFACRNVNEVQECARWLLSLTDDDLAALGQAGQRWVTANLEAEMVFRRALQWVCRVRSRSVTTDPVSGAGLLVAEA